TEQLRGFGKRLRWFLDNRADLARHVSYMVRGGKDRRLLAIPSRERLERVLSRLFDEDEFLSPYGIRSLSRAHRDAPFEFSLDGHTQRVAYVPGESDSGMFGGNSNWRGPVWLPMNWLIIEALERYHYFYGDDLRVECPRGSGRFVDLKEAAAEIARRLVRLFVPGEDGRRPFQSGDPRLTGDAWRDLLQF
ncbi:MAG: glucosidase, partial [Planctomycetes bacterium]|nr:glucosidase [Planctomycetota bacterium]